MTFAGMLSLIVLAGFVVAVVALARRISSWRLFTFGCVPAAVVVALAAWELNAPCDHAGGGPGGIAVLAWPGLLVSLTLYAGAAVAGVIEGLRFGKVHGYARAFPYLVVCPLVCVLGGGLVLGAALAAALHCFELS